MSIHKSPYYNLSAINRNYPFCIVRNKISMSSEKQQICSLSHRNCSSPPADVRGPVLQKKRPGRPSRVHSRELAVEPTTVSRQPSCEMCRSLSNPLPLRSPGAPPFDFHLLPLPPFRSTAAQARRQRGTWWPGAPTRSRTGRRRSPSPPPPCSTRPSSGRRSRR